MTDSRLSFFARCPRSVGILFLFESRQKRLATYGRFYIAIRYLFLCFSGEYLYGLFLYPAREFCNHLSSFLCDLSNKGICSLASAPCILLAICVRWGTAMLFYDMTFPV